MDILIIGNGFDLAHNLKTSYKDFLDYCKKLPSDNEFRNHNIWLNIFFKNQEKLGNTWIDLETEIYNIVRKIFEKRTSFPAELNLSDVNELKCLYDNGKVYFQLKDRRSSFFKTYNTSEELINFLYDQLRDFTKAFEKYLSENLSSQLMTTSNYTLMLRSIGVQQNNPDNLKVISFNYTRTCEKMYDYKFNSYCGYKIEPIYVHGKADNSDDCDLVLGTHSFDRNGVDRDLSINLNIFQKHNQRHKYGTIEAYQDFLAKLTDPKKIINPTFHIIGHSLDETDHNILKHIFTANKNTKRINIYYHNEEAQEKLINNITKIIGEAEVMTKVRLIHQHDEKRGVLKPINN